MASRGETRRRRRQVEARWRLGEFSDQYVLILARSHPRKGHSSPGWPPNTPLRPHIFPREAGTRRLVQSLCGKLKDHNPQRMPHWPERKHRGPGVCPMCIGVLAGPRG